MKLTTGLVVGSTLFAPIFFVPNPANPQQAAPALSDAQKELLAGTGPAGMVAVMKVRVFHVESSQDQFCFNGKVLDVKPDAVLHDRATNEIVGGHGPNAVGAPSWWSGIKGSGTVIDRDPGPNKDIVSVDEPGRKTIKRLRIPTVTNGKGPWKEVRIIERTNLGLGLPDADVCKDKPNGKKVFVGYDAEYTGYAEPEQKKGANDYGTRFANAASSILDRVGAVVRSTQSFVRAYAFGREGQSSKSSLTL